MKQALSRDFRFRLFVLMQAFWMTTLIVLTLWWGTLLIQQAKEIASLKEALGQNPENTQAHVEKMERMILFESGAFILLLVVTNGVLIYLFNRDHRRSKSIQTFFASLTHELKTPLTSIRLQAEALQDIEDDPRHRPYVKRLLEDVARLEGQLSQSLELARLEGGGQLNCASIPFHQYFQKHVLQNALVQSEKVVIHVLNPIPQKFIQADLSALNMIFRNILDNAARYSLDHPAKIDVSIQVSSSHDSKDHFEMKLCHTNSSSIEKSELSGELFARGKQSQGAGVGLYLVKTLMQKMSGQVRFESGVGTFTSHLNFVLSEEESELKNG